MGNNTSREFRHKSRKRAMWFGYQVDLQRKIFTARETPIKTWKIGKR